MRLSILLFSVGLAMTACHPPTSSFEPRGLQVEHATLLQGPGRAPRPGDPPFAPILGADLKVPGGLGKDATVWVQLLEAEAAEAWREKGAPGAVQAHLEPGPGGQLRLQATLPGAASLQQPRLGVELRRGNQVLGRWVGPFEAQYLPSAPPAHRRDDP